MSEYHFIGLIPLNSDQYECLIHDIGDRCYYRDWVIFIQPE